MSGVTFRRIYSIPGGINSGGLHTPLDAVYFLVLKSPLLFRTATDDLLRTQSDMATKRAFRKKRNQTRFNKGAAEKRITKEKPLVAVVMGSKSDWETMSHAAQTLDDLGIACETRVLSAHRTPEQLIQYVTSAEGRGIEVIIAAAGGAAHLAGVCAAKTLLPVLGVPMESKLLGLDSLLSTVQMPAGIPVATLAIGKAGAINAALFACAILGANNAKYRKAIAGYRKRQAEAILANPDPQYG